VLRKGQPGEIYNIGARREMPNIEIARRVLSLTGKGQELITFVKDRPGHDRRYSIDPSRIEREIGWKPEHTFDAGLRETIEWYRDHPLWVEHVRSGEYMKYYERMYGQRQRTLSEL
jgi:dTDP-glucose 4,6-dehydratase